MNKKQENNMTQAELELLVGKYFDCETTEEEEIVLKRALSECRFRYCIAYVNGVEVDDHEEVLALVKSSLNNVGNTTEMEAVSMESQFSTIREIMSVNDDKD